jgi:hypothetical protein
MRWGVLVVNFDGHPHPEGVIARGHSTHPLGSIALVREFIDGSLAELVWQGAERAELAGDGYAARFTLEGDPVDRLRVDVQVAATAGASRDASLAEARGLIVHLCRVNGWAALDETTGEFLDLEEPEDA